jgi:hypothetical protein
MLGWNNGYIGNSTPGNFGGYIPSWYDGYMGAPITVSLHDNF